MEFTLQTDFFSSIAYWLSEHGLRIVSILVAAALIDYSMKKFISRKSMGFAVIEKQLKQKINRSQRKRVETIFNVLGGSLSFVVYIIAILMVLPEFGVNIAPILAGLGLAGLAISMAAKDILSDFIAGFFILIEEQYNIGDRVVISGIEGKIREVTLRRTVIEDNDGTLHMIPNRSVQIVAKKKTDTTTGTNNDYY